MADTVIAAIFAYIATNIDDIFINTLFFAQAHTGRQIFATVMGKYLGTGLLVAASTAGAVGMKSFAGDRLWLLGLVPVILGIKSALDSLRGKDGGDTAAVNSSAMVLSIAAATVAAGADNIGIYIPLFAGFSAVQMMVAVAVFAVMTALWCFLSIRIVSMPRLKRILEKYSHLITPVVYTGLGIYIIATGLAK